MSESGRYGKDVETTEPYPIGGPPVLKLEAVTGEYALGEKESLIAEMQTAVPVEPMGEEGRCVNNIGDRDSGGQEGIPVDKRIHELTTEQLANAVFKDTAIPDKPFCDQTTEILPSSQNETAILRNELQEKIKAAFDCEVSAYLGEFNDVILLLLKDVRDKVCGRFEGVIVEEPDVLVEALNIRLVVEAIMTRQFNKLINRGYIQAWKPE